MVNMVAAASYLWAMKYQSADEDLNDVLPFIAAAVVFITIVLVMVFRIIKVIRKRYGSVITSIRLLFQYIWKCCRCSCCFARIRRPSFLINDEDL
jgi:hypothetical protein